MLYALGSLLNMLPYAILCYLPFGAHLRTSKRNIAACLGVLSTLVVLLSLLYANSPFNTYELWGYAQVALQLIYISVFFLTVKSNATKLLYVFILVTTYAYCVVGISHYIEVNMFLATPLALFSPAHSLIIIAILLITFPFAAIYLWKKIRPAIDRGFASAWKYMWLVPLIFLSIIIVYTGSFEYGNISSRQYLIILILIMCASFLTCYLIIKMVEQQDLSARLEESTKELSNQKKTRDMFFQNISHDLRTPISVIKTAADILAESELPPPEQRLVTRITGRTSQLENMVEDIMKLALIESGGLDFKEEIVDIKELLDSVHDGYASVCEQKGLELSVLTCDGTVRSDRHRILEVFDNLISNALRHTQAGGIYISAVAENGFCVLTVRDTGGGIPEKDLPYLFDRFYKGGKSQSGSGLGLCICKELVEHLGGTIRVENHPGVGAVFSFRLKM